MGLVQWYSDSSSYMYMYDIVLYFLIYNRHTETISINYNLINWYASESSNVMLCYI